ncbi:MAG: hypothetical protein OXF20_05345 [Gammaproteobacteria bacterium]|nr:hypothetical protein [Gammaproteobacteria bacterium]
MSRLPVPDAVSVSTGENFEAGVTVSLPQDDICDGCYPFGRNSMTETRFLAERIIRMMSQE